MAALNVMKYENSNRINTGRFRDRLRFYRSKGKF